MEETWIEDRSDDQHIAAGKKVSLTTLTANAVLTAIKGVVGVISGSTALVADAFHSGSDVLSTIIVLISLQISGRPADSTHPYGHGKIQALASKLLSLTLIAVGFLITVDGIRTMVFENTHPPKSMALWAILLSILAKEGMYQYTAHTGRKLNSSLLIADAFHHRSDALSSLAALAGVIASRAGYPFVDPLAAACVGILIIIVGGTLLKQSVDELMDKQDHPELINVIRKTVEGIDTVAHVDDVRTRTYGSRIHVDLVISVNSDLTVAQGHRISSYIRSKLLRDINQINDVLIHVEPHPEAGTEAN